MDKTLDCVVVGSCVVDVLARPVTLSQPIGAGRLIESDPLILTTGGIVSNSGITLARLGMRVAAFTYVGDDEWADVIRHRYGVEGIDTSALVTYPNGATSTTAVLIDPSGERSFVHCVGAPRLLDGQAMLSRLDLFARSRSMLLGYYPLMTRLQPELPEVLAAIRETGCLTAMDSAGDGGTMDPLAQNSAASGFLRSERIGGGEPNRPPRAAGDDRSLSRCGRRRLARYQIGRTRGHTQPQGGRIH